MSTKRPVSFQTLSRLKLRWLRQVWAPTDPPPTLATARQQTALEIFDDLKLSSFRQVRQEAEHLKASGGVRETKEGRKIGYQTLYAAADELLSSGGRR